MNKEKWQNLPTKSAFNSIAQITKTRFMVPILNLPVDKEGNLRRHIMVICPESVDDNTVIKIQDKITSFIEESCNVHTISLTLQ